jgi:hypothetical protein
MEWAADAAISYLAGARESMTGPPEDMTETPDRACCS